jgi:mannose-6-phosphate isomerase-like protein (cupin superfamily)
MVEQRPTPVGTYQILQDYEDRALSIRVLKIDTEDDAVEPHLHYKSAQLYVGLIGKAAIEVDGAVTLVTPYDVVPVPLRSLHTARAVDGPAVIMNISVPPLQADDQAPALSREETPDMRLPSGEADIDD